MQGTGDPEHTRHDGEIGQQGTPFRKRTSASGARSQQETPAGPGNLRRRRSARRRSAGRRPSGHPCSGYRTVVPNRPGPARTGRTWRSRRPWRRRSRRTAVRPTTPSVERRRCRHPSASSGRRVRPQREASPWCVRCCGRCPSPRRCTAAGRRAPISVPAAAPQNPVRSRRALQMPRAEKKLSVDSAVAQARFSASTSFLSLLRLEAAMLCGGSVRMLSDIAVDRERILEIAERTCALEIADRKPIGRLREIIRHGEAGHADPKADQFLCIRRKPRPSGYPAAAHPDADGGPGRCHDRLGDKRPVSPARKRHARR